MSERRRLVLASHNAGKLRELQALFDPSGSALELVSLPALGAVEPEEPHRTFLENALHKARAAAAATGLPALADDSGLAVAALGGLPGVDSATFAGAIAARPGEDREGLRRRQDAANIEALLRELQTVAHQSHAEDRRARFVCTLVAVRHPQDPEPLVAQGRWEGRLLDAPQGQGGFGYDPLLWVDDAGATVAALAPEQKNRLSHRAKAAAVMRTQMRDAWGWTLP